MFGHGETKKTCLWLHKLPKLPATDIVPGREQRIWKMAPPKIGLWKGLKRILELQKQWPLLGG